MNVEFISLNWREGPPVVAVFGLTAVSPIGLPRYYVPAFFFSPLLHYPVLAFNGILSFACN